MLACVYRIDAWWRNENGRLEGEKGKWEVARRRVQLTTPRNEPVGENPSLNVWFTAERDRDASAYVHVR